MENSPTGPPFRSRAVPIGNFIRVTLQTESADDRTHGCRPFDLALHLSSYSGRERRCKPRISQRGKEYLETARTLLRAAQTMTDYAIAGQLKALADDYERRAEKASQVDAAKALARSAANAQSEWRAQPDGQVHRAPGRGGRGA